MIIKSIVNGIIIPFEVIAPLLLILIPLGLLGFLIGIIPESEEKELKNENFPFLSDSDFNDLFSNKL